MTDRPTNEPRDDDAAVEDEALTEAPLTGKDALRALIPEPESEPTNEPPYEE